MICIERGAKYPGGKFVEVKLCINNRRIVRAYISGDFFLYPEECIEILERSLRGCCSEACIDAAIQRVSSECVALGLEWSWLRDLVLNVWREGFESCTNP